jgi:hypothetical protein
MLLPELACAQTPEGATAPVTIELPECATPPYDAASLLEKLGLELQLRGLALVVDGHSAAVRGPKHVGLILSACSPNATELTLRATDRDSRSVLELTLSLHQVSPEARARTVALVIAEALSLQTPSTSPHAPSTGAASPHALPAVKAAPSPALEVSSSSASPSPRGHVALSTQVRSPLLRAHRFWCAELSARMPLRQGGAWNLLSGAAEAGYGLNSTATQLGNMDTDWWNGSLGLELSGRGPVEIGLGPRVSLAYVSARPERPTLELGARAALMLLFGVRASVGLQLGGPWLVRGTLEIGRPLRGLVLTAGGDPSLTIDGWIVSSGLGLALQP